MVIELTKFAEAMSHATDFVEAEILRIPPYHEKRVAIMSARIAEHMGMDEETVFALTVAGALHDCALSEYLEDEFSESGTVEEEINMASHCKVGERMIRNFPFYSRVDGAILFHHERADGSGALGKTADETPIYGQILHISDMADTYYSLYTIDPEKYSELLEWIPRQAGGMFSKELCDIFTEAIDYELLESISGEGSVEELNKVLPPVRVDVPIEVLRDLSTFFAHITDYKSHFTWRHSIGIAEKAEMLGTFYGYDKELCDKLFIAGALHDIGKLLIPNDILEKPGRLTSEEYHAIQNHAMGTWELLHPIGGMEDITNWAALHHEKLDGSGYPFGKTGDELGKHERMMACLDIYQALVEERPYKAGLSHQESMEILGKMGHDGQLDPDIIRDIDACYSVHCADREKAPEKKTEEKQYAGEAWRCPVCGYVYEGALPEDFICPQCEQPRSVFVKI